MLTLKYDDIQVTFTMHPSMYRHVYRRMYMKTYCNINSRKKSEYEDIAV